MGEYIERKVVINRIKEYALDVYGIDLDDAKQFGGGSLIKNYCEGLYEATELVDDIPAADVALVVRCMDCVRCRELNRKDRLEGGYAEGVLWCMNYSDGVWPDDFCSYGKPKEEPHANDHD